MYVHHDNLRLKVDSALNRLQKVRISGSELSRSRIELRTASLSSARSTVLGIVAFRFCGPEVNVYHSEGSAAHMWAPRGDRVDFSAWRSLAFRLPLLPSQGDQHEKSPEM